MVDSVGNSGDVWVTGSANASVCGNGDDMVGGAVGIGVGIGSRSIWPASVPGLDGAMGSGKIAASDASEGGSMVGSGAIGREDGAFDVGNCNAVRADGSSSRGGTYPGGGRTSNLPSESTGLSPDSLTVNATLT